MRALYSLALLLAAGPALAGSVELVTPKAAEAGTGSITRIKCDGCPPPAPKQYSYTVPVLAKGKQTIELKMIDGKQKFVRTEAFLGGSPVVFISNATPEAIAALLGKPNGDGVDKSATTAAVPPVVDDKAPVAATMAEPAPEATIKPLDTAGFDLRSN